MVLLFVQENNKIFKYMYVMGNTNPQLLFTWGIPSNCPIILSCFT